MAGRAGIAAARQALSIAALHPCGGDPPGRPPPRAATTAPRIVGVAPDPERLRASSIDGIYKDEMSATPRDA